MDCRLPCQPHGDGYNSPRSADELERATIDAPPGANAPEWLRGTSFPVAAIRQELTNTASPSFRSVMLAPRATADVPSR